MRFTKMHALGNNYIYIDEFQESMAAVDLPALARAVSDVRRGIGSDGLILIGPSERATVRMRMWNADGSESETCGNGLRCVAKYAYEHGYTEAEEFPIEVKTGVVMARVWVRGGRVERVTIDMGRPRFGAEAVGFRGEVEAAEPSRASVSTPVGTFSGTLVSMGNPHFVIRSAQAAAVPLAEVGPHIEGHPDFAHRVNVEFVTPRSDRELDFRVWERGSGITLACGTGACASVAAGVREGWLCPRVVVHLEGGDLDIQVDDEGRVWMTGEAVEVMSGDFVWPRREDAGPAVSAAGSTVVAGAQGEQD
ncbi:diaminopimelate epimerase [Alicyclobacillus shizuokensis]|uniref:diaminopimelate epimerase n=1 Tax=Alicyclobacillus shizuokensis TaxID=392014 RepID=UPI0009F83532|nr:diaminopimelate epimerase [Alicyclobacillus shizuokensis]